MSSADSPIKLPVEAIPVTGFGYWVVREVETMRVILSTHWESEARQIAAALNAAQSAAAEPKAATHFGLTAALALLHDLRCASCNYPLSVQVGEAAREMGVNLDAEIDRAVEQPPAPAAGGEHTKRSCLKGGDDAAGSDDGTTREEGVPVAPPPAPAAGGEQRTCLKIDCRGVAHARWVSDKTLGLLVGHCPDCGVLNVFDQRSEPAPAPAAGWSWSKEQEALLSHWEDSPLRSTLACATELRAALAEITRQRAEIERLEAELSNAQARKRIAEGRARG